MAPRKRSAVDDSSSEEEINVDKMVGTKKELDKIRKDRDRKRSQMQKDLDKKLAGLRERTRQTVEAHTQQLAAIHQQRVDRLKAAVEARDGIEHMIRDKLAGMQRDSGNLAAVLDRGYQYRLEKAQSLATTASEQKEAHGHGQARPVKRVKIDTSSLN